MKDIFSFQKQWVDALLADEEVKGIVEQGTLTARERFEIYEDGFWMRLDDVMSLYLPLFKSKVDEDEWMKLVVDSVLNTPAHSWNIAESTELMVNHLKSISHPQSTIAEREWAIEKAVAGGKSAAPFLDSLAKLSPDQMNRLALELHPSFQRVSNEVFWSLGGGVVNEKKLSQEELQALKLIQENVPLAQWDRFFALNSSEIMKTMLEQWTQEGLITGYKLC